MDQPGFRFVGDYKGCSRSSRAAPFREKRSMKKGIMKNRFVGLLLVLALVAVTVLRQLRAAGPPSRTDTSSRRRRGRKPRGSNSAEQALTKAGDKRVRIFAERIIEDHRPISEELTVLASDAGDIPLAADAGLASADQEFRRSLSGNAFEHAWLDAEVKAHQELIDLFRRPSGKG